MIVYFSVENFLSLRDKVTLDFRATSDRTLEEYYCMKYQKPPLRLLKMAMIYGANASGKTNLLRAIDFLRGLVTRKISDKKEPIGLEPFALDRDKKSSFEIGFIYQSVMYEYSLELAGNVIFSEKLYHYPKGRKAEVYERILLESNEDATAYTYDYSWLGAKLTKENIKYLAMAVQNQLIVSKVAEINYDGAIQQAQNWFVKYLSHFITPESDLSNYAFEKCQASTESSECSEFFLEQLRKADFSIQKMLLREVMEIDEQTKQMLNQLKSFIPSLELSKVKKREVSFLHGINQEESYFVDFNSESLGTRRYFGLVSLMYELVMGDHCILIDEIESSLHIDLIIHFLQTFLQNADRSQLIFTSQNTALLEERDILRRDAIWITDRKKDESTRVTSVSDFSIRKEHSIGKMYRKGALGGIPNVSSSTWVNKNGN